ncbi:MAG: efflux RND transporter periplasmic adaptor subunit [Bacteroidota bacterium]
MRKIIIISLIVVLATAGGWYYWSSDSSSGKIDYRIEKVTKGDIQVVVTATGTLSAVRTVQVGSQVSGILSKINVDFNDKVTKGQIVAQIDPTFLEASVRDAEASLQRARAQLNKSKRSYERIRTLMKKDLSSAADYDAAITEYESSQASYKQTEAQLERAKINLRYATIKSPIDGVVISRAVDVGQTVAASLSAPTLFTIANDLTKMQVQTSVDEADIGKVEKNQEVTFTVDAYPEQTFKGMVRQVRLSPKVEQNVVNYTVIIDVPNEELKLMPGMTATVTIMINKKDNVVKVPTLALRFNPPESEIDTVRADTARQDLRDTARTERWRGMREGSGMGMGMGQGMAGGSFNPQEFQRRMSARGGGRIWIMNERKKLVPVMVRTGLSDGTFTEIVRGKIEEGQEIVIGIVTQRSTTAPTSSPFNQQRTTGGVPRRM